MKLLFTSLLIGFVCLVNAQSADQLVGKWGFKGLPNAVSETIDAENIEISKKMFSDLTFIFGAHGECELTLFGKTEIGKYTYNEETSTIIMIDQKGDKVFFSVEAFDDENQELTVKGDKMNFVLLKK